MAKCVERARICEEISWGRTHEDRCALKLVASFITSTLTRCLPGGLLEDTEDRACFTFKKVRVACGGTGINLPAQSLGEDV